MGRIVGISVKQIWVQYPITLSNTNANEVLENIMYLYSFLVAFSWIFVRTSKLTLPTQGDVNSLSWVIYFDGRWYSTNSLSRTNVWPVNVSSRLLSIRQFIIETFIVSIERLSASQGPHHGISQSFSDWVEYMTKNLLHNSCEMNNEGVEWKSIILHVSYQLSE